MTLNLHPLNPLAKVTQTLQKINADYIEPTYQAANYQAMRAEDLLADTSTLKMINGLEIEGFIPVKMAILLKLNWEDTDTASALLSNCVVDLRDTKKIISEALATFILDKIDEGDLTEVLLIFYARMRSYDERAVFEDQFLKMPRQCIRDVIRNGELFHSQSYLTQKIQSIAAVHKKGSDISKYCKELEEYINQNNPSAFKAQYMKLLDVMAKSYPEGVEEIIFEELEETVSAIPESEFFQDLYRILKTHEFYGEELVQVVDLTKNFKDLLPKEKAGLVDKCKSAFQNTLHLLADFKSMPCGSKTLYCLHHGLIHQEWRKINALFEQEKPRLCTCHAVEDPKEEKNAFWPLNQTPFILVKHNEAAVKDTAEGVAIFGCSWGNGHKQTSINIAEILDDSGMHPVSVNIPDEMLLNQDPARNSLGSWIPFSTTDAVALLARNKAYALTNLLRELTGFNNGQGPSKQEVRKTLQRLLLINPSYAITTIQALSGPVIEAASLMGIPCATVLTDVDRSSSRKKPIDYAHHKAFLPYVEDVMVPQESTAETSDQIEVIGPPTKKEYDLDRTREEVDALRAELGTKHNIIIPPGKKLVVISGGGLGSFSPYPELLIKKYKGKEAEEIPFVAVVLCGNNKEFMNHVTQVSARLPQGTIKPCESVPPEVMEKLYRVASYGGAVIGKSGGLTVFEISKCGTRLIVDNMPSKVTFTKGIIANVVTFLNWIAKEVFRYEDQLPWERINQDFAISQGFAKSVATEEEFFTAFDEMLQGTEPKKLDTPVMKSSKRIPKVLAAMKKKAEKDPSSKGKHTYKYQPEKAANLLYTTYSGSKTASITIPEYTPGLILEGKQFLGIHSTTGALQVTDSYDEKQAQQALSLLIKTIHDHRSGSSTLTLSDKIRLLDLCFWYVQGLANRYQNKLSQGLSECSSNPFLMSLAKLDRLVTAERFPVSRFEAPLSSEAVKLLYSTPLSKAILDKWLSESTHEARKSNSTLPHDKLVDSNYAAEAFLTHPEEVDFLTESYIHKQMGRLSEHVLIDPVTKHHQIRYEGTLQDVSSLIPNFTIKNKKTHAISGDQSYFFRQDKGLTEFDPENWSELPVFRQRKNAAGDDDYRLVLKTVKKDSANHSWIELKTPTEVYNVGYFWDDEKDSIAYETLCKTLRGKLHAVDKNELLGNEAFIQKTVSKISKEQFETLKSEIETFQNKPKAKMFNLINSNCSSWTRKISESVGLQISSKDNGTGYFTGKKLEHSYEASTLFGKIERCWHRFTSILRNFLIYMLSGSKAVLPRDQFDEADLPLKSFSDIFDPEKGFFDTPQRVREWQNKVAEQRAEDEQAILNEEGFSLLSSLEQQTKLVAARYRLPTSVTLPEPVVTF